MLNFFSPNSFYPPAPPCNVGLYSPSGGKNELGEKNSTLQGASHQKKIYRGEKQNSPTLQGVKTHLPFNFLYWN
jgi:hypothetical protein